MKLKKDLQLSDNFKINEFLASNDGQSIDAEVVLNINKLAQKLQMLRNIVGSITVNSGFRGTSFNKSVGGSTNSYHLTGLAADIKFDFSGWNRKSLTKILQYIGFTNVNFYWNKTRNNWVWLHVDLGETWNKEQFYYRDMDADTQKVIQL